MSFRSRCLCALAWSVVLAACSDNHQSDAGLDATSPLDALPAIDAQSRADATASPDGSADTDAGGSVLVTVFDGGPVQGAIVLFHDETGHVLEMKMTGADGKTSGSVPPGGMVTTATIGSTTIMGVNPGDTLVFGTATSTSPPHYVVLVFSTNTGYFEWGCGGDYPPIFGRKLQIHVAPECFPLNVLGMEFGRVLPFSYALATGIAASSRTTTVTVGAWMHDFTHLFIQTSSVPPHNNTQHLQAAALNRGRAYPLQYPGDESVRSDFAIPNGFTATGLRIDARYTQTISSTDGFSQLYQQQASITATVAFDWASMLPLPRDLHLDPGTAGRPRIAWTMRHVAQTIAVVATISGSNGNSWTVYAPATIAASLRLPELPIQLSALAVTGGLTGSVIYYADDGLMNWSQYLREVGTNTDELEPRLSRAIPGTVRLSGIGVVR
jgi:hypothetical protein